jgi:hypothetical protein
MNKNLMLVFTFTLIACSSPNDKNHTTENKAHINLSKYFKNGKYYVNVGQKYSDLQIQNISDSSFKFSFHTTVGANTGEMKGTALSINDSVASYSIAGFKLCFFATAKNKIKVDQRGIGNSGIGMGFDGTYYNDSVLKKNDIIERDGLPFLSKSINHDLARKSGDHFKDISDCFDQYSIDDVVEDSTVRYKQYYGFVNGLGGIFESIIICRDDTDYFVGLLLDDTIRLYSSEKKEKIPSPIGKWIDEVNHSYLEH